MKQKMTKLLALCCALMMVLSLSGCGGSAAQQALDQIKKDKEEQQAETPSTPAVTLPDPKPAQPSTPTEKPAEPQQPAAPEQQEEALTLIRDVLEDLQYPCAVAYLGYTEGPLGDGYQGWFEEQQLLSTYPFLKDLTTDRIIEQDGGEVYCIIPQNKSVFLSVHAQNFDFDGNVSKGDELFRSMSAEPFLVRGNISEIVPNTIVSIQYEDGSGIEFSPCLSGEDGHLSIADDQFIMDISTYSDTDNGYDADGEMLYLYEGDLDGAWIAYGVMYDEYTPLTCYLDFSREEDGSNRLIYWYGYENGEVVESFEGFYYESDIPEDPPRILFEMDLVGGSALEGGESYRFAGSFHIAYSPYGDVIEVTHLDGNPLIFGFDGQNIVFERSEGAKG